MTRTHIRFIPTRTRPERRESSTTSTGSTPQKKSYINTKNIKMNDKEKQELDLLRKKEEKRLEAAKKGGLRTKEKYKDDPDYWRRIGKMGGRPKKLYTEDSRQK